MKVKHVDAFVVRIPFDDGRPFTGVISLEDGEEGQAENAYDPTVAYPPVWRTHAVYTDMIEAVIVRIETDNGLTGWGEIHTPVGGEISKALVDHLLAPVILNQDPRDIHPLWEKMYATMRVRGQTGGYQLEAISGIDIALWDIVGKAVGVPVAKLLGGVIRDRISVYASCLPPVPRTLSHKAIQQIVERAGLLVERQYRAFKIKLGVSMEADEEVLTRLRQALGDDIGIAAYVNGAYDFSSARRAGAMMQAFKVQWLEDPLTPENMRDYARLAQFLDIPVAGGGSLNNRWQFNDFLAAAAFDLVQPDVGRAGGISECHRIATLADTYGVPFAPHVSRGTAIYMAASLQLAASGLNLMTCEWPLDQTNAGDGLLKEPFRFKDGYIHLSDQPGLGIQIDEHALMQWVA